MSLPMDQMPNRHVNKVCDDCGAQLHWSREAARCVDAACPSYWKTQGGIEVLVPSQGYVPTAQRNVTVIQKPQDL